MVQKVDYTIGDSLNGYQNLVPSVVLALSRATESVYRVILNGESPIVFRQ